MSNCLATDLVDNRDVELESVLVELEPMSVPLQESSDHFDESEIAELDAAIDRQEANQAQAAHIKNYLERSKPRSPSKLSDKQIEIARYRKEEGNELYKDYRKKKRWFEAAKVGRTITPRVSLSAMSDEEKLDHKQKQAVARQARHRAAMTANEADAKRNADKIRRRAARAARKPAAT